MQKHKFPRQHTDITPQGTILRYVQLPWLMQQYPRIPVFALYNFLSGFFSIGLMAAFAVLLHSPLIFPSLGPTAFHYYSRQTDPTASPRNAIIGHFIGTVAGYFSLVVTGLTTAGPVIANGMTWPCVIAAALSLGLTAGLSPSIASLACLYHFGVNPLRQPKALAVLIIIELPSP